MTVGPYLVRNAAGGGERVLLSRRELLCQGLLVLASLATMSCARRRRGYPGAEWAGPVNPLARTPRMPDRKVDLIIFYNTEHAWAEAVNYLRTSAVSAHYVISATGRVLQLVEDDEVCYHAGNLEFNKRSVSIFAEGYSNPLDSQNADGSVTPNGAQTEAMVALVRWLGSKYPVPLSRSHLIGKNQVPGCASTGFPATTNRNWGGTSNKPSPGQFWNWDRFMTALGRKIDRHAVRMTADCDVLTLPSSNAPIITRAWRGQRFVQCGREGDFVLIYVIGACAPQPYTVSGEYHWDGWIPRSAVESCDLVIWEISSSSPGAAAYAYKTPDEPEVVCAIAPGKSFIPISENQPDGWLKVDLQGPAGPLIGWIRNENSKSLGDYISAKVKPEAELI